MKIQPQRHKSTKDSFTIIIDNCSFPGYNSSMEIKNDIGSEIGESDQVDRIVSPHDKLVKIFLGEKETAASLFKDYLPAKISKNLDFDTLRISKDTFVDKRYY